MVGAGSRCWDFLKKIGCILKRWWYTIFTSAPRPLRSEVRVTWRRTVSRVVVKKSDLSRLDGWLSVLSANLRVGRFGL